MKTKTVYINVNKNCLQDIFCVCDYVAVFLPWGSYVYSIMYDPKLFLHLTDTCNETIRNLKTLGLESNSLSNLVFINFIISKLDPIVR